MKNLSILIVDDDEIERIKFKKVCKDKNLLNWVTEANSVEKALILLNDETFSFNLIVSDLNMPKMNGFDFLSTLKVNKKLRNIPVVIMSTSESKEDLKRCYDLGASAYFTKPSNYSAYSSKVISLLDYWRITETL